MHGAPPVLTAVALDLPPDCATFPPACDDCNNDDYTFQLMTACHELNTCV